MIYGKSNSHTWSKISRIPNLLKIGPYGDGKIIKDVIKNVQYNDYGFRIGKGIGDKNDYQAEIF